MDCILVFAAHPDDEGAMLGTLAKYANNSKVIIIWATKGERWVTPIKEFKPLLHWFFASRKDSQVKLKLFSLISRIREQETNKVNKLLNVKSEFLGFMDGSVPLINNIAALSKIIEIIRKYKPRVIITHHFREPHPDHKNLSNLVYQAFFLASNDRIITDSASHKPEILAWWDERGIGFKPNCYINIENTIKVFQKWRRLYKSQRNRIIGQIPSIKARLRGIRTPYHLVERFEIVNIKMDHNWFGENFPEFN